MDRHSHDLSLRRSEKEDAGSDDCGTLKGNEHALALVVTVDVIEVGVERFVNRSPALRHAVEDKRPECVLHSGIKSLYPNVVPGAPPQSITAVALSAQPAAPRPGVWGQARTGGRIGHANPSAARWRKRDE